MTYVYLLGIICSRNQFSWTHTLYLSIPEGPYISGFITINKKLQI